MIDKIGRIVEIDDRQMLYDMVLYVDANPAVGADTNNGSRNRPYLTIAAAVAAASEYTTIICADSRVGALAVGFDEDTAITGVTIDKNNITILGGCEGGHKVHVGNTIANADNVFNVTGNHVSILGVAIYLQDINGDEVTVLASGHGFRMECCDIPSEIPANAQNECIRITGNHFVLNRVHTVLSDVGLRCTGTAAIGRVRDCTFQAAAEDGVLLETGTVDVYVESCQFQLCGDAIDIDAGATHNAFYECNFANNTNIWINGGGATNQLINAKEESKITAGNTSEDDHKEIYDGLTAIPTNVGTTQVKTISVTAAANAGADTTLGTVTTQGCIIQGIVIHADAAQTADLTSCPVHGGAAKVLTFVAAGDATQANLDAENKQLGWDGEVYLPTGSTIVMVHNGTGATALNLTATIRYVATVDGGYLA